MKPRYEMGSKDICWVVLAQKDDGTWEIVCQTPYDEITFEAQEIHSDRATVLVETMNASSEPTGDRLAEIKATYQLGDTIWSATGDVAWLIAEVERLRAEVDPCARFPHDHSGFAEYGCAACDCYESEALNDRVAAGILQKLVESDAFEINKGGGGVVYLWSGAVVLEPNELAYLDAVWAADGTGEPT